MKNQICIRNAQISDAPFIRPLFIELMNIHADNEPGIFKRIDNIELQYIENEINEYEYFYVAEIDKKIIGYAKGNSKIVPETQVTKERKILTLLDLIIENEYRNKGIGTEMLKYIISIGLQNGNGYCEIPVYAFNKGARKLYQMNGFEPYVERIKIELQK